MQKVLWSKGVLLSPQHLQMQDRFVEETIGFQLAALSFHPWGFSSLEIDREALTGGLFSLALASGLFPDGMPFEIPRSDLAPQPRQLDDAWGQDQRTLVVHLAIPEHRPGGRNVSAADEARNTRYRAEIVLRRDENTGLSEKPVQVARRNFRLILEGESLEGYASIPVARVIRTNGSKLDLDSRFVPPLVGIGASEYLMGIARGLVELLSAKSASLSGYRRQRNQGLADFGVSDIANFWLLYTVNTHLPHFRHLYETRLGHPGELFSAMSALASSLTTFSSRIQPRELPIYDHTDLAGCFTRLDEMVRELLETVVPTNHVTIPLRLVEPSIYGTSIDEDRYIAAPHVFLAVNAEMRQDELIRKAPQLMKVSSGDQVERLIKQALPGVALRHMPSPPSALPIKLNYQYFQLDRSGAEWESVRRSRNIAVYAPSDFPEPRLELVILLPTPDGS